jgi:lysophospholipase L1-like esterase
MKRFLIAVNIILVLLLSFIVYREKYIGKLKQKLFPDNSLKYYQNRPAYKEQLTRYDVYSKKANIVMLGTSLTQDIDWEELMNRGDIVNRAYGGDIFAVMAARLPYVLALQPKICFIEGGINDIDTDVPVAESMHQLLIIIDTLQQHSVIPVLTTITNVANSAAGQKTRNKKINQFNSELYKLAKNKGLSIIDNNPVLAPGGNLKEEFAKSDGLHYLPKTYLVWKAAVEKVLLKNGL